MNQFGAVVSVGEDGAVIVALEGELDMAVAPALRNLLVAAGSGARIVRVDLTDVTFLDSSGIATLTVYGKELAAAGGRLQIGERSYVVSRVLDIAGLGTSNPCFDVL